MAETQPLLFRVENGVGWIVLNRPEARNAINADMRQAYFDALERCAAEPEIRAVVLTGTGKGFCTGADLSGSRAATGAAGPAHPGATRDAMRPSQRVIRALWDLEKPIVAAVNGVAAGLGAHLAYACDLVVAADDARFIETRFDLPALTARDANADAMLRLFKFSRPAFAVAPTFPTPPIDAAEQAACNSAPPPGLP